MVTGASSGLGVAFAQALAEAGADVALGARRTEMLEDTAAQVRDTGRRALTVTTDVGDPESCTALVAAAMAEYGRVDILVNNAGVGTAVPATRETPEQFRQVIDVNLNGSYWMAQACGRVMQPGSCIVNISSVLGLTTGGLPQAAYSASKHAAVGLMRAVAAEVAGTGVTANAVCPAFVRTDMTIRSVERIASVTGRDEAAAEAALADAAPLGRLLEQVVEALEADAEVGAALGAGDGVHLVDDHRVDAAQGLARLAGEHQEERLGRGDQDVRRRFLHRPAFGLGRVAGSQPD